MTSVEALISRDARRLLGVGKSLDKLNFWDSRIEEVWPLHWVIEATDFGEC
jgi:hypothetical protein